MKCPRTFQIEITEDDQIKLVGADCIKEECAWWVKASQSCAMEAIPRVIGFLGSVQKTIIDKLPPARG